MHIPQLIAHRGYAKYYPENTLCSLEAALPGACYVELDVQLSRDLVPVVIHDAGLERTAGVPGSVPDMEYNALRSLSVAEHARLGGDFDNAHLPALQEVVAWMQPLPRLQAFVEIKSESLSRFGIATVVRRVMEVVAPVRQRVIVISYDRDAVQHARDSGAMASGWVLSTWDEDSLAEAAALAPDYLFCNHRKIPGTLSRLPRGPWCWALYEITDPQLALDWAARGADLIETMAIGEMLAHPVLARRGCGG